MVRGMLTTVSIVGVLAAAATALATGKVDGTFVVGGTDAKLKFVRAARAKLDEKGKMGYAILISAREATGDVRQWKVADPKERGSFIYLELESNGGVWIAQLAHASAKSGNFGVVTEVTAPGFKAQGNLLTFTLTSNGEQEFTEDKYAVALKVDATVEP